MCKLNCFYCHSEHRYSLIALRKYIFRCTFEQSVYVLIADSFVLKSMQSHSVNIGKVRASKHEQLQAVMLNIFHYSSKCFSLFQLMRDLWISLFLLPWWLFPAIVKNLGDNIMRCSLGYYQ